MFSLLTFSIIMFSQSSFQISSRTNVGKIFFNASYNINMPHKKIAQASHRLLLFLKGLLNEASA